MRHLLGILAVASAGCVPYVLPPVTGAIGVTHDDAQGARSGFHVDAGLSPWQLIAGQLDRRWDVTAAGSYDHLAGSRWGGALAAGPVLHPWGLDPDGGHVDRVLPELVGRWTTVGRAAAVRVILERAAFVDAWSQRAPHASAAAYGEDAIGVYLEAGYLWADQARDGFTVGVGLAFRLSATAGIACCLGK
jgi:hypothetical protein